MAPQAPSDYWPDADLEPFPERETCSKSSGLGFRVQGLGFRVQGLGFRIQGLGSGKSLGGCSSCERVLGFVWFGSSM